MIEAVILHDEVSETFQSVYRWDCVCPEPCDCGSGVEWASKHLPDRSHALAALLAEADRRVEEIDEWTPVGRVNDDSPAGDGEEPPRRIRVAELIASAGYVAVYAVAEEPGWAD